MTTCAVCGVSKPFGDMARIATTEPEGLGPDEEFELFFCSVEHMTEWFLKDAERMRNE